MKREFAAGSPTRRRERIIQRRNRLYQLLNEERYEDAKRHVDQTRTVPGLGLATELENWCSRHIDGLVRDLRVAEAESKAALFAEQFGVDLGQQLKASSKELCERASSPEVRELFHNQLHRRVNRLGSDRQWQIVTELNLAALISSGKSKAELLQLREAELLKLCEPVDFSNELVDILDRLMPRKPLAARADALVGS